MSELSLQSLNFALGSIAFEREALMLRIESVSPEVEAAEQLSDQVLLLDETLAEFRAAYQARRKDSLKHPAADAIVADGVRSARAIFGA